MKLTKLLPVILFLTACNSNRTDAGNADADSMTTETVDTTYTALAKPDSSYEVVNTKGYYVWEVDEDKKTLKKNPAVSTSSVNADSVISGLNQQYENIQLEKIDIKNETIDLKIINSDYLTEQMGSSGAAQYLAQTVINLTSVPGIKYVHIDFKMGSHASPGTWSRKDFPGYIIIQ